MSRALVTGAAGQDGRYLVELLLDEGWDVVGLVRPSGTARDLPKHARFSVLHGDVLDPHILETAVSAGYDAIYHLAGVSHVAQSHAAPALALRTNAESALVLMDGLLRRSPATRFYFAGTSEMFAGMAPPDRAAEGWPLNAHSPYAAAKVAGFLGARVYRQLGLFAVGGIAFNHESRRRGDLFVTRKIANGVRYFQNGGPPVRLGNPDAQRDWHHAADTVRGMYLAMTAPTPDEYVFASGEARTVRWMAEAICAQVGVPMKAVVFGDPDLARPFEVDYLCGDPSRAEHRLGWTRRYDIAALIEDICG